MGELPVAGVSGGQQPVFPMQPRVDGELPLSESWAPGNCVTARPLRLFSVDNARHQNLALYLGGRKIKQLSPIKAEHLQSVLKAEQMTMKISPTIRAGPGLSTLILDWSCALAGVPAPSPEALTRGGSTELLGLGIRGLPGCPQGPCHGNRQSPRAGRTADAVWIQGWLVVSKTTPQAALRRASRFFPPPCTTLCVSTTAHLFPIRPVLPSLSHM